MALKKECPKCHYRNPSKAKKCRRCKRILKGELIWWVDLHFTDGTFVKRVGSYKEAKKLETKIKAKKLEQKRRIKEKAITFEEFWPTYFAHCLTTNKDVYSKKSRWEKHLKAIFGNKKLSEISILDVERYRQKRLKSVKPSTVNRETSILRHMLTVATKMGIIERNPLQGLGNLRENNKNSWTRLSQSEVKAILKAINPTYKDLCEFLAYSGRRLGEALQIRWKDINFRQKTVFIRETKAGTGQFFPLTEQALQLLMKRAKKLSETGNLNPEERVFKHSDSEFRRAFKRALKKAKLPEKIRIHDLRHSFASWCAEADLSPVEIQHLLGHKTLAMVTRYVHPASKAIRSAADRLSKHLNEGKEADIIAIFREANVKNWQE